MATKSIAQKDVDTFWKCISKPTDIQACWTWVGRMNPQGYGTVHLQDRGSYGAHRLSYELHKGPIPSGLIIRHTCDNPSCVNPAHLVTGTYSDNAKDRSERRRSRLKYLPGRLVLEIWYRLRHCNVDTPGVAKALADEFNITEGSVHNIAWGGTKYHVGQHRFKYIRVPLLDQTVESTVEKLEIKQSVVSIIKDNWIENVDVL